jgi:hypothetical protein
VFQGAVFFIGNLPGIISFTLTTNESFPENGKFLNYNNIKSGV